MNTYRCFGLNIDSCIPMPGCLPTTGETDVVIKYGNVPDSLPNVVMKRTASQTAPGSFLLSMNQVAKYLVTNGNQVTIERMSGAEDDEIRLFLMGSAWCALLIQRKLLPLHGSAINVDGKSVIFSGLAGRGKSTLAAAFRKRGYQLLSDDLCAISTIDQEKPILIPGYPWLKLWDDVLKKMDESKQHLAPVRPDWNKYYLPIGKQFCATPLPVGRVYILSANNTDNFNINRLTGVNKVNALIQNTYRHHQVKGLGMMALHFQQCTTVAQHAQISKITRPRGSFRLNKLVDMLIKDFKA